MMLLFASKVDASVDSLRHIWTNVELPDSTRFNSILEYYEKNLFSQPDSVILLTAYHIELAEEKNAHKQKAKALSRKAIAFDIKGNHINAQAEIDKVVDIYASINDSLSLMNTYNILALIHLGQDEYQKSLKYFSKSLDFFERNEMKEGQANVLTNIGLLYFNISNYDMALDSYNKTLLLFDEIDMKEEKGLAWLNMARIYFEQKNLNEAIIYNQKAIRVLRQQQQEYLVASSHSLNAIIYQETNQIDSALFYIQKGLNLYQKIGAESKVIEDNIILANLILLTDVNRATKIGEEVLNTLSIDRDYGLNIELYNLLYKCYKKKNEYALALDMLKRRNTYADTLRFRQNRIAIAKDAIQADYDHKILETKIENEKIQSESKFKQLKKICLILFSGAFVLFCIISYSRSNRLILKKEREQLLSEFEQLKELDTNRNQLIQSSKMASLGQLTAGVSHEINNPINFISSGIVGLKKVVDAYNKAPSEEEAGLLKEDMNDMINAIDEGAKRTTNIVNGLRMFSRGYTEDYKKKDIIEALEVTLTLLSNKFEQGVFIEKYFENKEMPIFCFPGQLNQVFMNVIMNAIQAVKGQGTIKIKVKEQVQNMIISISDNGHGITESDKKKIFEPFYTTRDTQEGTGLGLSIAFGIIKKHKGSIEVEDNSPKGTTIIINLPKQEKSLLNSPSLNDDDDGK